MNQVFLAITRYGRGIPGFARWLSGAVALLLMIVPAASHDLRHGDLHIGHAWAKAAAKGGTAEVYFAVVNRGQAPDGLVGAKTPVAARTSLAETQGGTTMPRSLIELAPSRPVALRPGRLHVRLEGLTQDLKTGGQFPLTLMFAHAPPASVTVMVETAPGH